MNTQAPIFSEDEMDSWSSWQDCDQILVGMLAEVALKAKQFLRNPTIAEVINKDRFVDEYGTLLDPGWFWVLHILVTLVADGEHEEGEGYELPLQKMYAALQSPSKQRFVADALPAFLEMRFSPEVLSERDEEEDTEF